MEIKHIGRYVHVDGYANEAWGEYLTVEDRTFILEKCALVDGDGNNFKALGLRTLYSGYRILLDRDGVLELLKFIDDSKILNVD